MNLKETVDMINKSPTMLVKVNLGDTRPHDMVVAKSATYHEEGYATILKYKGPRDWKRWADVRDDNGDVEKVVESTLMGPVKGLTSTGAIVNGVTPYETDLDTMPLRQLPVWAKELWVRQREKFSPDNKGESDMNAAMISQMKDLIAKEKNSGGLSPDGMTEEMRGRYLRVWYSLDALRFIEGRGVESDDLRSLLKHVRTLIDVVPRVRELPWRTEDGLDPESPFNREDILEWTVDTIHETLVSIASVLMDMIHASRQEVEKDG